MIETLFIWTWQASWQASLLALVILIARWVLGRLLNPRMLYTLWLLVLLRLLMPALPESPVGGGSHRFLLAPMPGDFPMVAVEAASIPHVESLVESTTLSTASAIQDSVSLIQKLSWIWGMGVMGMGVWILAVNLKFRRQVRLLPRLNNPRLEELWVDACTQMAVKRPPRIVVSDQVGGPALLGSWDPVLLLPPILAEVHTEEEWKLIFLHEAAHLKRGDLWVQTLLTSLRILHWFNPVMHFVFRQIQKDREPATDACVLAHVGETQKMMYGQTLLKVLERHQRHQAPMTLVGVMENRGGLKRRFSLIALFQKRAYSWSILAVGLVLGLGLFFLTKQVEQPQNKTIVVEDWAALTLAAARKGKVEEVLSVMTRSYDSPVAMSVQGVADLLVFLVQERDIKTFSVLLEAVRQSNLGKDWLPTDDLMAELVKDERKDFLEVLLLDSAKPLPLKKLSNQEMVASPAMRAWILQRVQEIKVRRENQNAFVEAANKGDLDKMRKLLEAGVDIDGVASNHHTALTRASGADQKEAVRFLLALGAQPDKPKHPGWNYTPLCLARSVEVAEMLKAAGADVHAKLFKRNVSILTYVANWNGAALVPWFIEQGLDPKMIGDNEQNLLFYAGDGVAMRYLLEKGVNPNHVDELGRTPIMSAKDAESVRALIEHGAKLEGFKHPLIATMVHGAKAEAVEAVLQTGLKTSAEELQSALVSAVHVDKADTVQVLLKFGAKANEPANYPSKEARLLPLEAACIWGSPKSIKYLLQAGADPNAGDRPGILINSAIANGHKEVAQQLREAGALGVSELAFALGTKDERGIKNLLAKAPTYQKNPAFWSGVLSQAARVGSIQVVRACMDHKVPLTVEATQYDDPYYSAASEGQHEILALLLAHPSYQPSREILETALWEAAWNSNPYPEQRAMEHFEKTVQLLLEAKAPVEDFSDKGERSGVGAVIAAVFTRYPGGNPRVYKMLVAFGANPNPMLKNGTRLTDEIIKYNSVENCSTLPPEMIDALEKASGVTILKRKTTKSLSSESH
ncbi:MAG: hypothetical protein HC904_04060 [Blastochloris sp.]|nr:hypothetical protein [Blastochloris sp.]